MRYLPFVLSFLFIPVVVLFPLRGNARTVVPDIKISKAEGPVTIEADSLIYDRETQLYHAHGNVEVIRGDFSLKADHAQLNPSSKDLEAWGNVLIKEGEDVIECERIEVNAETRVGKLYRAKLFLKAQNCHITGREMEKLGENLYRVREASFTTCDAIRPPWKFTSEELEITVGGYGIAKGPVFHVMDIPVLYSPWAAFPVRRERETGFLTPEVGYSSRLGPEFKTAFFWAISKDMDATIYLGFLGDRGFKEGLEYRYALTPETSGTALFYFIDDKVAEKNRYAFFAKHQQKLPSNFYLKGDFNYASDNHYPRDFDEDLPERTRIDSRSTQQLRSALFGGKNGDRFSFLGQGVFFKDLTRPDNDETVQKLPQMSFFAHPQPLFRTPFFYEFSSSYTHFWREKGINAHRWDLFPRVSFPTRLFDVLKLESTVGLRETLYKPDQSPTDEQNRFKSREIFAAGIDASTELYRVFEARQGSWISNLFKVSKWMHTIEPTVSYKYIPRVRQDDFPRFDDVDWIPYTNQIRFGATQRLMGKRDGIESGAFEYARLTVSQNYSLGDPFWRDEKGRGRPFSNIQLELWCNFSPYVYAKGDAELNPYRGSVDILNTLINLKNRRNDSFQIEYRFTKENVHALNLDVRVKTINPLYLFGAIRYNLLLKQRVENLYGIEYQAQCWTMRLLLQDINRLSDSLLKRELKLQVYLELKGVGSFEVKSPFRAL